MVKVGGVGLDTRVVDSRAQILAAHHACQAAWAEGRARERVGEVSARMPTLRASD